MKFVYGVDISSEDVTCGVGAVESSAHFFFGRWLKKKRVVCSVELERVVARVTGRLGVAGDQITVDSPAKT